MVQAREGNEAQVMDELRATFGSEFQLEQSLIAGAALVERQFEYFEDSGKLRLFVWLPDGSRVVAEGKLEGIAEPWVSRLVQTFQQGQELRRGLAGLEDQIHASVSQISSDFEEQSYLRSLAEQIEICEVSRELQYVVERVLSRLRRVIRAESVVFVPTESLDDSAESKRLMRYGVSEVTDDHFRSLVRAFRDAAERGPVVRNVGFSADARTLGTGVSNFLCVHVMKDTTRLGWLVAVNREATPLASGELQNGFGTVEAGLMQVTALILATHARNVELFRETESLTVGVVRTLVSAVEARDSYTRGHSERVALVARRLAKELGLNETACERIYVAGLLHDVGKIGVSDDILQKPGQLTPEEFQEIQKHPDIGYSILADLTQMEYLLPGVLYHHERLDGRGYPDGLVGDSIPFQARILAVADAWDAMTSARPYREPMPRQKVESIIAAGRGTQWDSAIVDAFMSILDEVDEICRNHESPGLRVRRRTKVDGEEISDPTSEKGSEEPVLASCNHAE